MTEEIPESSEIIARDELKSLMTEMREKLDLFDNLTTDNLLCPTVAELDKKVRGFETRISELFRQLNNMEERLLAKINRGHYPAKTDPDYDRKHIERQVRDIINDVLEERERMDER